MQKKCNYWLLCHVVPRSAVTDPALPLSPQSHLEGAAWKCPSLLGAQCVSVHLLR